MSLDYVSRVEENEDGVCYECGDILTDEELNEGALCFDCYDMFEEQRYDEDES